MSLAKKTIPAAIALIGDETMLGRELKEVLEARAPYIEVEAYAATGEGNFSEQEGETVYVKPLDAGSTQGKAAIVVAGSADGATKAYETAKDASGSVLVIDCTGFLENQPEARVTAPLLEEPKAPDSWLLVTAHPAASALALLLARLSKYRELRSVIANIFEPASERGKRGLTELHQQTTSLLAFKTLDKEIFDAQLAFNVLPRYGESAPLPLIQVEQRIERETATLLSRRANGIPIPLPSIRLAQAPVFHGYSLSLWVEFKSDVTVPDVEEALASAQIEIRRSNEEPPNNAEVAGQSGLVAGDIRLDRNTARAVWIWVVFDNLRLTANAVTDVLRSLVADAK